MKRRILSLIVILTLSVLALASCQFITNSSDEPAYPEYIVHPADFKTDMREVAKTLSEQWGTKVSVMQDGFPKETPEIAIGNTNRPVTAAAKSILESKIEDMTEDTGETDIAGYIVYSDGESIALYWNVSYAMDFAIDHFITNYVNAKKLPLNALPHPNNPTIEPYILLLFPALLLLPVLLLLPLLSSLPPAGGSVLLSVFDASSVGFSVISVFGFVSGSSSSSKEVFGV